MSRILAALFAIVILIVIALSCLFVVDQRQYAIVMQFGEIRRVIDEPGLYWKIPAPIQSVDYIDKRILTLDTPDVDRFITSEKLNVRVDHYVKWRIMDPRKFRVSVGGSEVIAQDRLARSLRDSLIIEIARHTVSEVISGERDEIMDNVRRKVNEDAAYFGVEVVDVRLKRVDFEAEVADRVFNRMQSERKRVANERRATGAAEAEKIRADAERQREVILAEAYRDSQIRRGQGDARASTIYNDAYAQNPEFAAFYRRLDAYRQSFTSRGDVMVLDPNSEFLRYMRTPDQPAR